jgi:glycylpeptide N-tetradecanoyltransferase
MPQENSKVSDPDTTAEAAAEAVAESSNQDAHESGDDSGEEATEQVEGGEGAAKKKKRSRKRKLKDALTGKGKQPEIASTDAPAGQHLSKDQLNSLLDQNPALKDELLAKSKGKGDLLEQMRNLNMNEMLTGLAPQGRNVKDMATHAFWKTQPVPSFDEMAKTKDEIVEGPIKEIDIEKVDKNPSPMYPGFEWVTVDIENEKELEEVHDLLSNHYVEDSEAMFRFRYSKSFINWYVASTSYSKGTS